MALFILTTEFILPLPATQAFTPIQNQAFGEQYITAPAKSLVMLSDEDAQARQTEIANEPKTGVAVDYIQTSAYNSVPGQTDASPYHTAIGSMTRKGVVASNYLPIGTYIEYPEIFPGQIFRVEDRMNNRYHKVVDILLEDELAQKVYEMNGKVYPVNADSTVQERRAAQISAAKMFGRRYAKMVVHEWGNNCRSCK